MILVVSLNPALDVTHHVAGVDWSGVNRPQEVSTAPGGKGLNVARTLRALGAGVRVAGLAGGALRRGLAAGPAIVKPNLPELQDAVRRPLDGRAAVAAAAAELRAEGAHAVVVSLGHEGLLAVTGEGTWHAAPPAHVAGNPTGAGDAVVAGLAHGLVLGRPWAQRLRHAVALGTACVAAPAAGEFAEADYQRALAGTQVTEWAGR